MEDESAHSRKYSEREARVMKSPGHDFQPKVVKGSEMSVPYSTLCMANDNMMEGYVKVSLDTRSTCGVYVAADMTLSMTVSL